MVGNQIVVIIYNTAVDNLPRYCDMDKLKVNLAKTKVVKFRKGDRLAREEHLCTTIKK